MERRIRWGWSWRSLGDADRGGLRGSSIEGNGRMSVEDSATSSMV